MTPVAGFPYFEVEYTADGAVFDAKQVAALRDFVVGNGTTDLVLISHGWNNDMSEARDLYTRFLTCLRAVVDQQAVAGLGTKTLAVMAVLWPSKKFADEQLTPSGAAALGSAVSPDLIGRQLDRLETALGDATKSAAFARARALVPLLV